MNTNLQNILTAVSASFATVCFLLVLNPDAFLKHLSSTPIEKTKPISSEDKSTIAPDPYIGEIILFAGNFAPRGWAFCDGQILSISQNDALFSILGTIYGGDGRTSFALPDLRGRVPVHPGEGPGLSRVRLGEKFGTESNTTGADTPISVAGPGRTGNTNVSSVNASTIQEHIQPSLGLHYIIALEGLFPPRS